MARTGFFGLILLFVLFFVMPFGMLLTMLTKSREGAARSQSTNNLKQIAIAFHNYHDTLFYLPCNGGHTDPDKLQDINFGWHHPNIKNSGTWATMILPFIEQEPMWKNTAMDHKNATDVLPTFLAEPKNQTTWAVTIKAYNCPGRGRQGFKTSTNKDSYPGLVTDYALNVFLNSPPKTYSPHGFAQDGGVPIEPNSRPTIQGIADGSSNTIMVAGKALPPSVANTNHANKWDEGIFSPGNYKAANDKSTLNSTGTGRGHTVLAKAPGEDAKERPKGGGVPWIWQDSELALTDTVKEVPDYSMDWGTPYPTGLLVAFGDGSVRSLKVKSRGTVNFARMLYPADGNVIVFD